MGRAENAKVVRIDHSVDLVPAVARGLVCDDVRPPPGSPPPGQPGGYGQPQGGGYGQQPGGYGQQPGSQPRAASPRAATGSPAPRRAATASRRVAAVRPAERLRRRPAADYRSGKPGFDLSKVNPLRLGRHRGRGPRVHLLVLQLLHRVGRLSGTCSSAIRDAVNRSADTDSASRQRLARLLRLVRRDPGADRRRARRHGGLRAAGQAAVPGPAGRARRLRPRRALDPARARSSTRSTPAAPSRSFGGCTIEARSATASATGRPDRHHRRRWSSRSSPSSRAAAIWPRRSPSGNRSGGQLRAVGLRPVTARAATASKATASRATAPPAPPAPRPAGPAAAATVSRSSRARRRPGTGSRPRPASARRPSRARPAAARAARVATGAAARATSRAPSSAAVLPAAAAARSLTSAAVRRTAGATSRNPRQGSAAHQPPSPPAVPPVPSSTELDARLSGPARPAGANRSSPASPTSPGSSSPASTRPVAAAGPGTVGRPVDLRSPVRPQRRRPGASAADRRAGFASLDGCPPSSEARRIAQRDPVDDGAARRSVVPPAARRSLWLAAAWTGVGTALVGGGRRDRRGGRAAGCRPPADRRQRRLGASAPAC